MPYQIPSLEDLQKYIKTLRSKYLDQGGINDDRLKLIERLEKLSEQVKEPNGSNVLIGAILYFSTKIKYLWDSKLYNMLYDGPHNNKGNLLTDKQKLICLNELFIFANDNKLYLDFAAEHKEPVAEFNKAKLKPIADPLTAKLQPEIMDLFSRARIVTIGKHIQKLPEDYKEAKKGHSPSFWLFDYTKERNRCLAITKLLNSPFLDTLLPSECTSELSKEHYKYTIRCGYILAMMKYIKFAKNSELYKLCVKIFGTEDLNCIPATEQKIYISNFRDFLLKAQKNPSALEELTNTNEFSKTTPADKFLGTMVSSIDSNFKGVVIPVLTTCLILTGGTLTQFVVGLQIAKLSNKVWQSGYGKGVLPLLLAEVGALVGGQTGRTVAQYMGVMYEEAIMLALYSKGIGFTMNQAMSIVSDSPESAQRKESKAVQKITVQLDRKIDQTIIKKSEWLNKLVEEMEFIQAVHTFCPDEFIKLKTILESAEDQTLAPTCEKEKEVCSITMPSIFNSHF